MDKDIIRERWIMGDLKDELGLKHRREIEQEERERKQTLSTITEDVEMNVRQNHTSIASFGLGIDHEQSRDLPKLNTDVNYEPYQDGFSPDTESRLQLPPSAVSQNSPRSVTSSRTTPYNVAAGTVSELDLKGNYRKYDDYPPTSPIRFSSKNPFNESNEPLV